MDLGANSVKYKSLLPSNSLEKKECGFELDKAYSFQKRNDETMNPYSNHSLHESNQSKYTSLSEIKANNDSSIDTNQSFNKFKQKTPKGNIYS